MVIYFGADHGGFELKERLKKVVKDMGYEIFDCGNKELNPEDDYSEFAGRVAQKVSEDPGNAKGILVCRSGSGMAIAANKFQGVRAALSFNPDHIFKVRNDDDCNILALPADFVLPEDAEKIVKVFLLTPFESSEKRVRRLKQIEKFEKNA